MILFKWHEEPSKLPRFKPQFHLLVSEEDVSCEAQEIEMELERYVGDLHLALTGEGPAAEGEYSFHLTPERPGRPLLQLSYEKVQNDISVSDVIFSLIDTRSHIVCSQGTKWTLTRCKMLKLNWRNCSGA